MTADPVRAYADLRRRSHNRPVACLWLTTCILIAVALACGILARVMV